MPEEPPQRAKWKCVSAEVLKAIIVRRLQEIVPQMQRACRTPWPQGCFLPRPKDDAEGSEVFVYEGQKRRASDEVVALTDFHPGYSDVENEI